MGLHRAGFEVEGWDIKPKKNYPFTFHLGDALEADLTGFDFVWASPPCQAHSAMKTMPNAKRHEDLIPATRAKLEAWGGPYIIENVVGAPLINPVMLCGSMFGLTTNDQTAELRRHRLFESNLFLLGHSCSHGYELVCGVYGGHGRDRRRAIKVLSKAGGGYTNHAGQRVSFSLQHRKEVMGIDWMTGEELSQAIPPAYSEFLGRQIIAQLTRLRTANHRPALPAADPHDASSAPPEGH